MSLKERQTLLIPHPSHIRNHSSIRFHPQSVKELASLIPVEIV